MLVIIYFAVYLVIAYRFPSQSVKSGFCLCSLGSLQMGIAASVYGCLIHSKELALETGEDVVVEKVGDEFRQRLEVYGCFMQTIFQVSGQDSVVSQDFASYTFAQ